MSKEQSFEIKPCVLPKKNYPAKSLVYDKMVKEIERLSVGSYSLTVGEGKKVSTVYQVLHSKLKDRKHIKLHKYGSALFVEIVDTRKTDKEKK
jgi:hypothetical protein